MGRIEHGEKIQEDSMERFNCLSSQKYKQDSIYRLWCVYEKTGQNCYSEKRKVNYPIPFTDEKKYTFR